MGENGLVGPTLADIDVAADALRRGRLVVFPTETVYGIGASARNPAAVRRLYEVKARPPEHPVIVHLADVDLIGRFALDVPPVAKQLAAACWPGPLTLVLRALPDVAPEVTGGLSTVGLRVPDQEVARALLRAFGDGVAAPSANRFGRVSPTTLAAVRTDLGEYLAPTDVLLDDGPCCLGVESTVVDCTGDSPVVLRPGGVTSEQLAEILGREIPTRPATGRAPGTLASHDAPTATVVPVHRADASTVLNDLAQTGKRIGLLCEESVLANEDLPDGVIALEAPRDVTEYARVLYARLRDADFRAFDTLVVVLPAATDLGEAVIDRIRRAAGQGTT